MQKIAPQLYYFGPYPMKPICHDTDIFDIDHTIVKPHGENIFPKSADDWEFIYEEILDRLRLEKSRRHIIFISNQSGFAQRKYIEQRLLDIIDNINIIAELFVPTSHNYYRKPNTRVFEDFIYPRIEGDIKITYVGDAAGRKGDFAATDRKFAYNIHLYLNYQKSGSKIQFQTPQQYFLGEPGKPMRWEINPCEYIKLYRGRQKIKLPRKTCLVIFICHKLNIINPTLEYMRKHGLEVAYNLNDARRILANSKPVIFAGETASAQDREKVITIAQKTNPQIEIIAVVSVVEQGYAQHLITYGVRLGYAPPSKKFAANFNKNYENPDLSEGIDEIFYCGNFVPNFHNKYQILMFIQRSE